MNETYTQNEKEFAKQNNLSKSYARKILAGELTLDQVREKIRLQNQPIKNKGLKYLLKHLKAQTPFVFALYNGEVQGSIKKVRKYDLHVVEQNTQAVRRVKKLDIKYFYKAEFAEDILDLMKIKPALHREGLPPILERDQRFKLDPQMLENCLKQRKPVKIMLRGGEIFKGNLRWISDYESKLQLDEKTAVVFFHHALYEFSVATPNR
jgi:sRNA-binding regulator protein Hfq